MVQKVIQIRFKMKTKITLLFLLLLTVIKLFAQNTWVETEISKNLTKKLQLSFAPEVRFSNQFSIDEYFIEPSLEYEFNKYFQLGDGYRFGFDVNNKHEHEAFGRFHFDAKTGLKWNNLQPKFRLRFTNSDDFGDENSTANLLRYKFELEYKLKKWKTEPYVLYELYQDLDANEFNKARFETGINYKINKRNQVGAYFRTNNYLNSNKDMRNIIGFSYKLKL